MVDLEAALAQQEAITELSDETALVVKTGVLEETLDEWPSAAGRRRCCTRARCGSREPGSR